MKIKNIFKLTSLLFVSITPISTIVVNQNNNLVLSNSLDSSISKIDNSNQILSSNNQDVNQAITDGFISSVNNKIIFTNFYGEKIWEYDLLNSLALTNKANDFKSLVSSNTKYDINNNRVIVYGNYLDSNNQNQSYLFQLNKDDGLLYLVNEDNSLPQETIYANSIVTSKKDNWLIKDINNILVKNSSMILFNKNSLNNKPIELNSNNYSNYNYLTFDNTVITTTNKTDQLLSVVEIDNNKLLLTTASVVNNKINTINFVVINKQLKVISINTVQEQLNSKYSIDQLIKQYSVFDIGNNQFKIVIPFVENDSMFINLTFNISNLTLTKNENVDIKTKANNIAYLSSDLVNKKIYFTTNNTTKGTLFEYDLSSNNVNKLSDNNNYLNAKIATFLTDNSNSQFILDNSTNEKLNLFGFITTIGIKQQKELSINIPQFKDFNTKAIDNGLNKYMPTDLTSDQLETVLEITNYDANDYNGEVKQDSIQADNQNGTINFDLNINIKKWWKDTEYYTLTKNIGLSNLSSNINNRFELVINSSVDSNKYNKVLEIQRNYYPSSITKKDILDYFISYGKNLSFTENDISINEPNSNTQIKATIDQNTGILEISYNITENANKISLDQLYKSGKQQWNFSKKENSYNQLTINQSLLDYLKNNLVADIGIDKLITAIDFNVSGNGYSSSDLNKWEWSFTNHINSKEWINEMLEGRLNGTLKYIRGKEDPSVEFLPDEKIQIKINETGFKRLDQYLLDTNSDNTFSNDLINFDQTIADKLTITNNISYVENNLKEILDKSINVKNNWLTINNFETTIISKNPNQMVVELSVIKDSLTNLNFAWLDKINLTNDWFELLNSKANGLFDKKQITLNIGWLETNWNYQQLNEGKTISLNDLNIASLNKYKSQLPSSLVNYFKDNPMLFQEQTNLLYVPNNVSKSNTYDFEIKDISFDADNNNGVLSITYKLYYSNLDTTKNATISINGFMSNINIVLISIASLSAIFFIIFLVTLFILISKRNKVKKAKY